MTNKNYLIFLFMFIFCLVSGKSLIIFENQPSSVYQVGDTFNLSIQVSGNNLAPNTFLDVNLNCNSYEELIYRTRVNTQLDKKEYTLNIYFSRADSLCKIETSLGNEKQISSSFSVRNDLEIESILSSSVIFPGENLSLNGSVKKQGSVLKNGIVFGKIGDKISFSMPIIEGKYSGRVFISKETIPDNYELVLNAEERGYNQELLNSGKLTKNIVILAIPTSIKIVANESIVPPENMSFEVDLLDQIGKPFENHNLSLKLIDPNNFVIFNKLHLSGQSSNYFFNEDSEVGAWKLIAYYGQLSQTFPIYVLPNEIVSVDFNVENATVLLRNLGNVDYNGIIVIEANNASSNLSIPLNVSLEKGQTKFIELGLYGNYSVSYKDMDKVSMYFPAPLTGAVIGGNFVKKSLKVIWLFLISLALLGAIIGFHRYRRRKVWEGYSNWY